MSAFVVLFCGVLSGGTAQAAGTLRWGGDLQGGEPYVFEDPKDPGHLIGFEAEIAAALGRRLGVRTEFVQSDWSNLVPLLQRGAFDIILNGFEITESRRQRVLFSRPYHHFSERLVVRQGAPIPPNLAALAGRRIGTLANTQAWDLLGQVGADRVPYEGVQEPFLDLLAGRVEGVLIDDIICDRYGRKPGLMVAGDLGRGAYAIGFRSADEALRKSVDEALGDLERNGELANILGRWGLLRVGMGVQPLAPARRIDGVQVKLFLSGAVMTIAVSVAAMVVAVLVGLGLVLLRRRGGFWRAMATAYVEIFRGTPVLLQLYVIYFAMASVVSLPPFVAAVLGLGLNYAAYEAENYRAGIQAVPVGQVEAGLALGMSDGLVFRRVVLPQAVRVALPGMTNDFIALLKDSSLVSVITVVELTKRMTIAAVDLGGWMGPGLLCAGLYFAMSYPLSLLARRWEARLAPRRS